MDKYPHEFRVGEARATLTVDFGKAGSKRKIPKNARTQIFGKTNRGIFMVLAN
tara:strand:+ start:711 stop:869 length:159 start_codon:yes stop_codon:yes gene_type:complete